jgi:cysteinylglycine-S-conjugate dipeptidase
MELDDVRLTLTNRMVTHRLDLERLVAIPSVSAQGFDHRHLDECAAAVRDLLADRGLENAQLLTVEGAPPAVYAEWRHAGPQRPTVLLYAHHDVQPPGEASAWTSPPFAPTERDGRLYGRGAADDKAGIMVHVAAVDAWLATRDALPVNVKVVVEGEEEVGSAHLEAFLTAHRDLLDADVMVLADAVNWKVGVPAVTYLTRGLVDAELRIRGLDTGLHSGLYGGPVAEPLTALVKVLAQMTDDDGRVAIPGFADDAREPTRAERDRIAALDLDEAAFRAEAGIPDGVDLVGDPDAAIAERLWLRPTASVIGLDAPRVDGSSNTIAPQARARVSLRLAPGRDPRRALDVLTEWLRDAVPWGLQTEVVPGAAGAAYAGDPANPAYGAAQRALSTAFGSPAVLVGVGGSIPFLAPFAAAFGDAPALLTGVEDPAARAHGIDESLHLGDWERACLGEALLFAELATLSPGDLRGDRRPVGAEILR